ncbi:hypothetical protein BV898_07440 [Hypsibius exemplaris]|uniref:ATP-dependent DNA helicase n=1 Tax=Hypsibius exemplaris TaxID=2072580 RepID=A0A1W0WTA0_HYPEX|nr:hypothetical protein BV898_07440 [Hypsibius exemplaris]
MDFEFNSRIQHGTFQAKALSNTQLVFVDEVNMMPREALMMLGETLRKFNNQNNGTPFAGKSISVISENHAYFFTYGRLLSMKEDFSLPEMIHHTSNSSPTFDNGWGNAYNIKSIALAAQRKIFVYGPVNRADPQFHDKLNLFQVCHAF